VTELGTRPTRDTTWRCPRCNRAFARKAAQLPDRERRGALRTQGCRPRPLRSTAEGAVYSGRKLVVSLPCCIHLYGEYDFLAVLPKKDRLEIRFACTDSSGARE
jgi:hypothetical protein